VGFWSRRFESAQDFLAGIHFTVKIQNTAKHQLLAIFMVEKRFAAKIECGKNLEKKFCMKKNSTIF